MPTLESAIPVDRLMLMLRHWVSLDPSLDLYGKPRPYSNGARPTRQPTRQALAAGSGVVPGLSIKYPTPRPRHGEKKPMTAFRLHGVLGSFDLCFFFLENGMIHTVLVARVVFSVIGKRRGDAHLHYIKLVFLYMCVCAGNRLRNRGCAI